MAPISSADVSGMTGLDFVAAILGSEDLDNSFFSTTDVNTLAALAEPRVQEIVARLNADLAADPLANATRVNLGLYFLRAAAYVDFYSAAIDYSATLRSSVANLLIAVGQNPQFLAPGFLDARAEWAVVSDSWFAMPAQLERITSLLRRYLDTPSLQNAATAENRTEGTMMYSLLNGMARTANQDPNWAGHYTPGLMQALSDLALSLPHHGDIEFIILDAIYALGRLRSGEPVAAYQGQAHQILSQVLQVRAVDSPPRFEALMALESAPYNSRLADGTPVDIAGYRQQLASRVFPHTFSFDAGTMTVCTPLDEITVRKLYDALREEKAQFFRVTQALRPIDGDTHSNLTLRIYGTMRDYHTYQRFLYGLGTDNGGIYIEDWATFFTYQRTPQESIYTLEELTRHEYIHYLDAYYMLVPGFGDSPWYDNDHLTWHSEGLAEFLAGGRRTEGVPVRASQLRGALSPGPPMTIAQIIGASYASGFGFYPNAAMFFQFLHERHPELHWNYFRALYGDDLTAYDTLTRGWRADAALQAEYGDYLTGVNNEVGAGTRLTAEEIPTGYKPDVLYGVAPEQIQSDIQGLLPAGVITASGGRFHFTGPLSVTLPDAGVDTPERFQAEFGRLLDQTLNALTPLDAHYRCATAWFEQLGITGNTATAAVHLESWFNRDTAPAAAIVPESLAFDTVYSDDAAAQTLVLTVVNTSPNPLLIQSVTLTGVDAGVFGIRWDAAMHPSLAGRGSLAIEVSVQPSALAKLPPGTYTATLDFRTFNGTPALVQIPLGVTLAAPLFVDGQAPVGGDGSSWTNAFQTISAAIAAAPTGNEPIFVAAGSYAEAVTLRDSLHLYGGFSGLTGARETRASLRRPEVHVTTISGPAVHVVDFAGTRDAVVDGFTITGGRAAGADGAGVNITGVEGEATLRHCIIQSNQAEGSGGGVYVENSAARIENCAVLGNTAAYGGGIAIRGGSTVTLRKCWIAGNDGGGTTGSGIGGGLYVSGAEAVVEDSQITGNTADSAAGFEVSNSGGNLTLRGTLVAANVSRGWFGGGANYSQSTLRADQCVFFRNVAGAGHGFAGIGTVYGATSTLRNCIVAGHQGAEATGLGWGEDFGVMQARHCLFYDNTMDFSDGTDNATGAAQLNALTGVFSNAFAADPRWVTPTVLPGTVAAATYDGGDRTTLLSLGGASLAPGGLRGCVIRKGATAAAAVLANSAGTITVFGKHDTLAEWTNWQPLDFHLADGSPAIDAGVATDSVVDPDGFPRGVDLTGVPNGPGVGFDLGLHESHGSFTAGSLLRIEPAGESVSLRWPPGMPGWKLHSSTDLRRWTVVPDLPSPVDGWQEILLPRAKPGEFFRLQSQ